MLHALTLHSLLRHASPIIFINLSCGAFGVPAVADALLVAAGVLSIGGGSVAAPFAAAVLGSAIGMTTSFLVGRRLRQWPLLRDRRVRGVSSAFARAAALWRRFGPWSLVAAYFTPGMRHVTAAAAGAAGMDARRFVAMSIVGASLWAGVLLLTGRVSGDIGTAASAAHRWYAVGVAAAAAALVASTRAAWPSATRKLTSRSS